MFVLFFLAGPHHLSLHTHLYMAAVSITEVSKVKGQGVWPHSPLHHKAQVGFVAALCPAHVLVVVDELFGGQKHTGAKGHEVSSTEVFSPVYKLDKVQFRLTFTVWDGIHLTLCFLRWFAALGGLFITSLFFFFLISTKK